MASNLSSPHRRFLLTIVLICAGVLLSTLWVPSDAAFTTNITSDGKLPTPTSVSKAANVYNINGGTIRGSNLFHSFQFFNVGTGDIASFNGPANIANILSRVTGGQSMIDGQLRSAITGANLYLMNPAGVVFGPNATLNVSGSFHVTTADYLRLSDGVRFTAMPGPQDALLSTAPVAAFGFLGSSPASVSVQGSTLQVPTGQTLSIVAGDINITSADTTGATPGAVLRAAHGQINIASVGSLTDPSVPGEVIPNAAGQPAALELTGFASLSKITESNSSNMTVSNALGSGTVVIRGGRLTVTNNAAINANTTGNANGAPVGIDIRLTDDLVVSNGGLLQAFTNSGGRAGNIQIVAGSAQMNAGSVQVTNDAAIFSTTTGTSQGPGILINTGSLEVSNGGFIEADTSGAGRAGNVDIMTNRMVISSSQANFSDIGSFANNSNSKGGDLHISASSMLLEGGAYILTGSIFGTFGDSGNMVVTTGSLEVKNGASIGTTSLGGHGGNFDINANTILISGVQNSADPFGADFTGFSTSSGAKGKNAGDMHVTANEIVVTTKGSIAAGSLGPGDAGVLKIDAGTLEVLDGATIFTSTKGTGNGGDIIINANHVKVSGVNSEPFVDTTNGGLTQLERSAITSQVGFNGNASQAGGNIRITSGSVEILDGGNINIENFGAGKSGNIEIKADQVLVSGVNPLERNFLLSHGSDPIEAASGIRANTFATGPGGTIHLAANGVTLNDGAVITASSSGSGLAGNISITAADRFVMRDSSVTTQATVADGGNITIRAGEAVQLINSSITTSVGQGLGNGGNITIDPQFVILQSGSQILANAFGGHGGNINITAGLLLISPDSDINASSALGLSGTITINSVISDLSGSLTPLPQGFLRKGALLSSRCAARVGGSNSSFVVAGREAVPMEPGGLLPSPISEPGTIRAAESAPGEGTMVALNLAAESLDEGCRQ